MNLHIYICWVDDRYHVAWTVDTSYVHTANGTERKVKEEKKKNGTATFPLSVEYHTSFAIYSVLFFATPLRVLACVCTYIYADVKSI